MSSGNVKRNEHGFEIEEDGNVRLPAPKSVSIELYLIEGQDREFGMRVVLPEGRTPEMYAGDNIMVAPIEVAVSQMLMQGGLHAMCVEVQDFDGRVTPTREYNTERVMRAAITSMVNSQLREKYDELMSDGVIDSDMTFDDFRELELARVESDGAMH